MKNAMHKDLGEYSFKTIFYYFVEVNFSFLNFIYIMQLNSINKL